MEARKAVNKTPWHPPSLPPPRTIAPASAKNSPARHPQCCQGVRAHEVLARYLAADRRGGISHHPRRKWFGQDDSAAHHRRIRERDFRRNLDGRRAARSSASVPAPREHSVPALCFVSSSHGRRKRGLRTARGETARGRDSPARGRGSGHGEDDGLRHQEAVKDQRRTAAAHCAGAGAGEPPTTVVAGRAALRAGRQPAPPDAGGTEIAAARSRHSFVFVTHDQEEAMVMSDRIALLRWENWNRLLPRARFTTVRRPPTPRSSSATPIC